MISGTGWRLLAVDDVARISFGVGVMSQKSTDFIRSCFQG